jgi:hypothetical protein
MNEEDVKLAKKKILKCLTEDFEYGTRKDGKPLKHKRKNQAIFDKKEGWAHFTETDLDMVMERVVLGLYFAMDDSQMEAQQ